MSLGAPLGRLARDADRFVTDWPHEGAVIVERAVTAELRSAPGGGNVPGVGRATIEVQSSAGSADVSAAGSMRVWAWSENGTRAHAVEARRGRLLRTPYGPRQRVRVSGWRASHAWSNGVERAEPAVMRDAMARLEAMGS